MSVELPKDAEGREIPLDTEVLYDKDGKEIGVSRYQYYPKVGRATGISRAFRTSTTDRTKFISPRPTTAGTNCLMTWTRQVTRGITRPAPTSTETKTKMAVYRAPVARTAALELPCATLPPASEI